jgi:hypothetical protein
METEMEMEMAAETVAMVTMRMMKNGENSRNSEGMISDDD